MRLKLFRAAAMSEAMARVRAELGEDALILSTRRVAGGVEITAALEPEEPRVPVQRAVDPTRLAALEYHGVPAELREALLYGKLDLALAEALPFAHLPLGQGAKPLLLVGPPGAGKTLTVARLATRLVMAHTAPVVITSDGKRAGAIEQLAAFTRILGISLIVACRPATIVRVLEQREQSMPVLIDTAGCNPTDPEQSDELAGLAAATSAASALVLPAGLDTAESAELGRAFASIGTQFLIATKLDVARRLGGILAASASAGLALAEAGIGPGAADGLALLTPDWLAARLLAHQPLEPRQ
jgi:flagellar biosynthesis protein FlhF